MKQTVMSSALFLIQIGIMSAVNSLPAKDPEALPPCSAHFTWTQTTPNIIAFSDTSSKGTTARTIYHWSFGDGTFASGQNPTHTYNVPGHYTVCLQIAAIGGCHSAYCDTLTVTGTVMCNLTVQTRVHNSSCSSLHDGSIRITNIQGGIPPYKYVWTPGGATTPWLNRLDSGIYTVCVTDRNGCSACVTDTVKTRKDACQALFAWSQTAANVLTFNDVASVAGPHASFHWNFGDGQQANGRNPVHQYLIPGSYKACLTITDTGCCYSMICEDVVVTGKVICNLIVSPASHTASCDTCANGAASVMVHGGSAPYAYSWSNGDTTRVVHHLVPGTYTVCVTDSNKCMACTIVTITGRHPHCSADFDMHRDTTAGMYTAINESWGSGKLTYLWTWGDGSPSDTSANPSHTYATPGSYQICLTITDTAGCSSTDCDILNVRKHGHDAGSFTLNVVSGTGAGNIATPHPVGAWNLYPNPSSGTTLITYSLTQKTGVSITVYDLSGKEVMQLENKANLSAGSYQDEINAGSLQPGTYLINIRTTSGSETKRLTIIP